MEHSPFNFCKKLRETLIVKAKNYATLIKPNFTGNLAKYVIYCSKFSQKLTRAKRKKLVPVFFEYSDFPEFSQKFKYVFI